MDNINIWFARNKDGNIVTIDKINENNRYEEYSCPICESKLIAKLGEKNAHHLAHKDASKCSRETQIHFFVKNELLKQGDKFTVKLDDESKEFICKDILIEQKYKTEFGVYNPDITVITEDGKTIYFEVSHTNKKRIEDYLDMWMELNNIVVEVESRDMINGKFLREFNAKFYEEKCFNIKQEDKEYYELIGKIKLNNEYPIEQIKKLDWLWKDINKYLLEELDISELSDEIQTIEDNNLKEIIVSILRKNRCRSIMNDYIKYNINYIESKFKNVLDDKIEVINPRKLFDRIYGRYNIYNKKYFSHTDSYAKEYYREYINLTNKNDDINRNIDKITIMINLEDCKKSTDYIEMKIKEYLLNTDDMYSIFLYSSSNFIRGKLKYDNNELFEFEYKYYNNCDNDIIKNIKDKVINYKNTIDIIDSNDIHNLNTLSNEIDSILKLLNPLNYKYYTRITSWHPKSHKSTHYYRITSNKLVSEDVYEIIVGMKNTDIKILINNNTIDINNSEKIILNNKDYIKIKNEIMTFISEKIREERYKL